MKIELSYFDRWKLENEITAEQEVIFDAGYFAIKRFISNFDYGVSKGSAVPRCNSQEAIDAMINGKVDQLGYLIHFFSKKNWYEHCLKYQTYHYSPVVTESRTGYGIGEQYKNISFAKELKIDSKCIKYDLIETLLGIDIDNQGSKEDVFKILEYINSTYFESSMYFEPSTSGSGIHGYVKFSSTKRSILVTHFNNLQEEINEHIFNSKLNVTVELKGIHLQKYNESNYSFGQLFKLPRMSTLDSVKEFYFSKSFNIKTAKQSKIGTITPILGNTCSRVFEPKKEIKSIDCAFQRKLAFTREYYKKNNNLDLDTIISSYFEEISDNECLDSDIKDFIKIVKKFNICKLDLSSCLVDKYNQGRLNLNIDKMKLKEYSTEKGGAVKNSDLELLVFALLIMKKKNNCSECGFNSVNFFLNKYLNKKLSQFKVTRGLKILSDLGYISKDGNYVPSYKCTRYLLNSTLIKL